MKFRVFVLAMSVFLTACTSLQSKPLDYTTNSARTGLHYAVPKALLSVEILESNGLVTVFFSKPEIIGDASTTFLIDAGGGMFADLDYDITVDPETRLLKTVNSTATGRLDDIAANIAKAVAGVPSASVSGINESGFEAPRLIYHRVFDPMMQENCEFATTCSFTNIAADIRAALTSTIECEDEPKKDVKENALCDQIRANDTTFVKINLFPLFESSAAQERRSRSRNAEGNCGRSICYRAPVPYELRFEIDGMVSISQIVELPNGGPVLSIDVPSALFAKAETKIVIDRGMPSQVDIVQGNELAALTAIPANTLRTFLTSASEIAMLRVNYNNVQAEEITSQASLETAIQTAQEAAEERRRNTEDGDGDATDESGKDDDEGEDGGDLGEESSDNDTDSVLSVSAETGSDDDTNLLMRINIPR